ncbi:MAG: superoxide dismutase [Ni] [Chlamydiota bacterium]|nr:superoxide dismutase [Ni] [Chlamydiota bacterium]
MKNIFQVGLASLLLTSGGLNAHCQMPCGIYHDDMVIDQIDQYAETMYKAVSELNSNLFNSPKDKNQFVRWVLEKEKESDVATKLITEYFLQQKVKPDEDGTENKVLALHKVLFLIVKIKQNTEKKYVLEFMNEWKKFKEMYFPEGFKSRINVEKQKIWREEYEAIIDSQK